MWEEFNFSALQLKILYKYTTFLFERICKYTTSTSYVLSCSLISLAFQIVVNIIKYKIESLLKILHVNKCFKIKLVW